LRHLEAGWNADNFHSAEVATIAQSSKLEYLDMGRSGRGIGDAALITIARGCPLLRVFSLYQLGTTDLGIAEIRSLLPRCKIIW
jgi:hypothetical protein